jgi:putative oxidoreductase
MSRDGVRRLYSTFAGGWPGIALLLMRLVVGAVVLWHAGPMLSSDPPLHIIVAYAALALAALLLIAGLWTPVAGAAVAVIAISEIVTTGEPPVGRLLAATIAGALTMLGPGRLSIDARLFGWRRIDVPIHRSNSSAGCTTRT